MAEILNQDEINRLFNLINTDDSGEPEEEGVQVEDDGSSQKIYGNNSSRHSYTGLHFNYKSPVIKSHQIIFDPESSCMVPNDKIVVRSLSNYQQYRKFQNE